MAVRFARSLFVLLNSFLDLERRESVSNRARRFTVHLVAINLEGPVGVPVKLFVMDNHEGLDALRESIQAAFHYQLPSLPHRGLASAQSRFAIVKNQGRGLIAVPRPANNAGFSARTSCFSSHR